MTTADFIQLGQPQQNAYVERYNRTVRYDWLAHHLFDTFDEIQDFATRWLWMELWLRSVDITLGDSARTKEYFMTKISLSVMGSNWIHNAWHHKTSVIGGILAIISLSLAHYAGFLMKVPLQIVAVAGMPLAKGVTATFLFYVFFCAVFARVLTSIFQLAVLPLIAAVDRFESASYREMDWHHERRFVRSHSRTIKWEGLIWVVVQSTMFLLMMFSIYIEFTGTWASVVGLLISILLVILTGLFRSGFFLQPKSKIFINKIKARPVRKVRAASAAFVTATGALIIVAFFMGAMRASLLRDQQEHPIVTKEFTGKAAIIASADGTLLLLQKQGNEMRYIYSTAEFTASIETKSVFPPLGTR